MTGNLLPPWPPGAVPDRTIPTALSVVRRLAHARICRC